MAARLPATNNPKNINGVRHRDLPARIKLNRYGGPEQAEIGNPDQGLKHRPDPEKELREVKAADVVSPHLQALQAHEQSPGEGKKPAAQPPSGLNSEFF